MRAETTAIEEIVLRGPGLGAAEARELALKIADYLASNPRSGKESRHLAKVDVRLSRARNTSLPALAETIGKAILARLD